MKVALVVSSIVYPKLYPVYNNIGFPLLIGGIISLFSFILGLGAPI